MGGYGSGRWSRSNSKSTVFETKRIDIRYMKRKGLLKPNTKGSFNWDRGGKSIGSISFECYQEYLLLKFRFRRNGDDWQSEEQRVCFDRTSCHYGGQRLWFSCPECSRRVAILCSDGPLFLCRHCYQLPYASQNESTIDRLISQRHMLGERIFVHYNHGEGWGKKKGMHQKTFDRLYARFKRLDRRYTLIMAAQLPEFNELVFNN